MLIHNYKPELILKEDSNELKQELIKKEDLIRRHYDKLGQWQALLQDKKGGGAAGQAPPGGPPMAQGKALFYLGRNLR